MSSILYKRVDGEVKEFRVNAVRVNALLQDGYFASPDLADADTNESGKLSNEEIRAAAKAAGIANADKAQIKTLKKKLNEQD